ncbi:hypothetical protein GOFOIKOB_6140 [Methylobacterium tardum]|uniref:Uncharacterized protein n=1 Tax=Methylobacterium tardum TaxID=374432 RepID=A0AA37THZ7_9HYPH|nr:hypothetical protein [Methylobacterium tardum]URD38745.1 hypothetical protein M6G65_10185 [Methylobacterium tardum]GJE53064.1 hypothetical protein GOFOIKOB_6140 [Methylobacterium tardum]GLS68733.1 hypothetical protein GCM10007890_07450 [Methylobacterium tardum]
MTPTQIQRIRDMLARLRDDPVLQAMIARNTFNVADTVTMVVNLNSFAHEHRHQIACRWCAAKASGRWRRRVVERVRNARLDKLNYEFEVQADAAAFEEWLSARGW